MQTRGPVSVGQKMYHVEYGTGIVTSLVGYEGYLVTFSGFDVYFSNQDYWTAYEEFEKLRKHKYDALHKQCLEWFDKDFLNADRNFRESQEWSSHAEVYLEFKSNYLRNWFATDAERSGRKDQNLDSEQLQAIGSVDGNYQVIARAGSGKTTVSVLRAYFLIKHCGIKPRHIMLLAFNRDAAFQIRQRLLYLFRPEAKKLFDATKRGRMLADSKSGKKSVIDINSEIVAELIESLGVDLPFAMTFHSLAYALVQPEGQILMDDDISNEESHSALFEEIVKEILSDELKALDIKDLMMRHFKQDYEKLINPEYAMSDEELLRWRRSLPHQSIDGKSRKSSGEKLVSDFLFEHSIEYFYERNAWWDESQTTVYKPDFTILNPADRNAGLVIEYFGMVSNRKYREQIAEKRRLWQRKKGWSLLELYPEDIAKGSQHLESVLTPQLQMLGIPVKKLTEEEIWAKIREDAIFQYTRMVTGFVTRCRQVGWNSKDLTSQIGMHQALKNSVESLFLRQAPYIYQMYESKLRENGATDFPELMSKAVSKIQLGSTTFSRSSGNGDLAALRYLFVDEFQDFSFLFDSLLKAILAQNTTISIFCVGDDWQAINGFAGSDLQYFNNFIEKVPNSSQLYISTNYRSDANIVGFGNGTMNGLGKKAVASRAQVNRPLIGYLDNLTLDASEIAQHGNDVITPALLRLINSQLLLDRKVVLLSRTTTIPYYTETSESARTAKQLDSFLKHLQSHFPDDIAKNISIRTSHKYKGREREAVVIIDANVGRYPLVHRNWIFNRIFGVEVESLIEDDRRLFYVAATRAIDQLFVLCESREKRTPYILPSEKFYDDLDWNRFGTPSSLVQRVLVQVTDIKQGSTHSIKELLKANNFNWSPQGKYWHKSFLYEAFSIESLKGQPWSNFSSRDFANHIKVTVSDGDSGFAEFEVLDGDWVTVLDWMLPAELDEDPPPS
jgi:DNA helicase-4